MTDKHSPEAVEARVRKEIGVEGWQNLCHVEDGLNALQPGDRLPGNKIVASVEELRLLTELVTAVRSGDPNNVDNADSALIAWENCRG